MLRNITASKPVIEPLNSFKNKIITILTPWAKLIEANTKIK